MYLPSADERVGRRVNRWFRQSFLESDGTDGSSVRFSFLASDGHTIVLFGQSARQSERVSETMETRRERERIKKT